jgi:hypothetical protein
VSISETLYLLTVEKALAVDFKTNILSNALPGGLILELQAPKKYGETAVGWLRWRSSAERQLAIA